MRRKRSAQSLRSDSGLEDYQDDFVEGEGSIFMADATSSDNGSSDMEKDDESPTLNRLGDVDEEEEHEQIPDEQDGDGEEEINERSRLLERNGRRVFSYSGPATRDYNDGFGFKSDVKDYKEEACGGASVPNIVYASPARPYLPSPSASNPRVNVTPGMYLPYNWRTPAMVPYDVQAHPFNRAPNASPVGRTRYPVPSDTDGTGGGSTRDNSVWSVEMDTGSCGCLSVMWEFCFGRAESERINDTPSDG